jgi:hypothetical protein
VVTLQWVAQHLGDGGDDLFGLLYGSQGDEEDAMGELAEQLSAQFQGKMTLADAAGT